jgi:hypothetical protein
MFKGWIFHMESGVHPGIRGLVERHEGLITEHQENATCCLVDIDYVLRNKSTNEAKVLADWVAACHIKGQVVSKTPFLLTNEEDERKKRLHGALYSVEEDETLLRFAKLHEGENLTQEKLWNLAEEEGILERNAVSMLHRYRFIKQKTNKKNKHYTEYDVNSILAWAYCWYRMEPKQPHNGKIWEVAASRYLVYGKTASELESKFEHLTSKHGGKQKTLDMAKEYVSGQIWLDELYDV